MPTWQILSTVIRYVLEMQAAKSKYNTHVMTVSNYVILSEINIQSNFTLECLLDPNPFTAI